MDHPRLPLPVDPAPFGPVGGDDLAGYDRGVSDDHRDDGSGEGEPTWRVSELTMAVDAALAVCFPDEVWVRGEVSSLRRASSGHVYFDLVEPGENGSHPRAKLAVALFATDKASVNATLRRAGDAVRMTDGVEIRLRARVAVYGAQGQLQLKMTAIDPAYTLGQMADQRQRTLRQLAAEGLLEANARLVLAPRPWRIGLVTSVGSAAEADFLHELDASGLAFEVVVVDARVQGRDAARSVAAALARLAAGQPVDVVALVRGGGARTDLAAFDELDLARAVARCPVPVMTGIGHEIDSSVADQVAQLAHKTPTACAAHLVERARHFHLRVEEAFAAITTAALARLAAAQRDLARHRTVASRAGSTALAQAGQRLDERHRRLARSAPMAVRGARLELDAVAARVAAVDPARALARGWSITRTADGTLVRDPGQLRAGDRLVTTVAGGVAHSQVVEP